MKNLRYFIILFLSLSLQADFIVKSYQELKNQKVIRQNYEESCGASSLATLINILDDKNLSELELLKTLSEKELYTDMLSFADLIDGVKKLGYKAKSYKIDKESLDKLTNIPMLVKIEDDPRFPHFVVIINHKGGFLQVLDPSYGEYISSKREFFSVWDRYNQGGYALVVLPKKELAEFKPNLPKESDFERRVFGKF
ncbi:MAG: C39 family peptidase [Campylobacter sp.]|nr:C39 family peptidase [Campylobacter sp.]